MVAKTLYGLEDVLAEELAAIGAEKVEIGRRMVSFVGDKAMLYKANFYCHTALRILKPLTVFSANHADDVYREVKKIEWEQYLTPEKTFSVDAVIYSESFNHSKFVAYRTKDAIADYFFEKYEKRPSVRVNKPDIYINIHISHNDCTVSLDSSGESLHKRGYRVSQVDAPLNEVLAAGMILKTGWRGESNFIDPMCGSGTLLIEAAMIALNIPPGIFRKEYAFERWPDYDGELFEEVYNDESTERDFAFKCYGSDISPTAVEKAMKNIRNARLSKYIEVKILPFQQYTEAVRPGILVMNPPYGERISTNDLIELYSMIGERLKHAFTGFDAWILSYKDECFEKIGLHPKQRMKLMNGELECEYRCYELFEGKNKEFKMRRGEEGREAPSNSPLRGRVRSFERKEKSFERERKPFARERKPFERKEKPFERREKPFGHKEKPFENRKKPFEHREKPFERREKSFEHKEKPFEREYNPFERKRKPFEREQNPFERKRKPFEREQKPFARERKPFDRDRKPFKKEIKPYDRNHKPFRKNRGDRGS